MRSSEADHPWIYGITRKGVYLHERLRHDLTVVGRKRIPKLGGGVVAYSHRDGYDPVAVTATSRRVLFNMGKKELWEPEYDFEVPILGTVNAGRVAEFFGSFPVDRKNPRPSSFRHADNLVADGMMVAMAPEMSRYEDEELKIVRGPELGHLYEGAGTLALRNEAYLVPMGVKVLREEKKDKSKVAKIAIVINESWVPKRNAELSKKEDLADIMARLRLSLQEAHYEADELAA